MRVSLSNRTIKLLLGFSGLFVAADTVYKTVNKISFMNRERCILYQGIPRPLFLVFEYCVELSVMIFLGIFLAALAERLFTRFRRFYPGNPFAAWVYGSLIPVCSCSALPMAETMREKMNMRVILTFIVAAPILNPYIIFMSFSVLGWEYGLLRIASSFALSIGAGYLVGALHQKASPVNLPVQGCAPKACTMQGGDVYQRTISIFVSILPYLGAAAVLGILLDLLTGKSITLLETIPNTVLGRLAIIAVGVPLYLCNGTDVLILRPLLHSGVSLGTAVAFSLTSTSVCITSIVMCMKFITKRTTFFLVSFIFAASVGISFLIDAVIT
jgi:uncharacterized protein